MSSGYGPLELLLTPEGGSIGTPTCPEPPLSPNPTVWISFTGGSNESVATFIQSVQRVAFQHGRMKDDDWVAELASTGFTGKALVWYLGLDKETRLSWEKLRVSLIQHYSVQVPDEELDQTPAKASLQPAVASPAIKDFGRIEVIRPGFGDCLGFLSQDRAGKFVVDTSPEKALTLQKVLHTDSDQQQSKIYSLKIVNAIDPRFSFLGLRLVKSPGEDADLLPPLDPDHVSWMSIQYMPTCRHIPRSLYQNLTQSLYHNLAQGWSQSLAHSYYQNLAQRLPQNLAQGWSQNLPQFLNLGAAERATTAYATWDFIQTTESKPGPYYVRKAEGPNQKDRVVSAVWTITDPVKDVAEVGLTWPSGDDRNAGSISEIRLDAILHKGGVSGLHVHPYDFVTNASSYLDERHVVLVFKQILSLPQQAGET